MDSQAVLAALAAQALPHFGQEHANDRVAACLLTCETSRVEGHNSYAKAFGKRCFHPLD
jgi:hypothetical protein